MSRVRHVIPENDLMEHVSAPECPCCPRREDGLDWTVYVHDALDGRPA